MEPTLVQVFGTGTVRLANGAAAPSSGLFIPDSVLQATGLATPSTATAEGHIVALIKAAKGYLTQANFDANINQSLIVGDGYPSFTTRGTDQYRVNQLTLSLAKIDDDSTINPNDY